MTTSLFTDRAAHFSPCRKYRYRLSIRWDERPLLVVIGLNPSTADETKDDPTLRRCQGFARDMGRGGLLMLNAFAWRSTDPRGLRDTDDPVGPENTTANLAAWIEDASPDRPAIAAWGVNCPRARHDLLMAYLPRLDCFGITSDGYPRHPLYLKASLRPKPFNYAVR